MRTFPPTAALGAALIMLSAGAASAQSVTLIGTFKDWAAYSAAEGTGSVCFAMSKPTDV